MLHPMDLDRDERDRAHWEAAEEGAELVREGEHEEAIRTLAAEIQRRDPASRFLIVGDGERRAELEAQTRALGLQVMLGCMIESELGIAQAAQLGSLADHIDLDGHLLISSRPFPGLGLQDGRLVLSDAPGLGVERA